MDNRRSDTPNASRIQNKGNASRNSGGRSGGRRNYRSPHDRNPESGQGYGKRNQNFANKKSFGGKKGSYSKTKAKPWNTADAPRIVSDMQITDGKHRGKYLKSSTSPSVKPTVRKLREVMFRILIRKIRAGRFLDLCAGAGTMGIEAISRGALIGTFVERSAKMCSFIKKNLDALEIKLGHGEIFEIEAVPFLKRMAKRRRYWDVVYYDPPLDADFDEVLDYFKQGVAIRQGGVLVIEHHVEMFFPETMGCLRRWKVVVEGESAISFYERKS
ncbi:MAG: 16S rRNA (guanine(966)-N(2))-methyltransferase RsmD [Acidobacteria bacterium]|nr:16S rRNA (guanine(966)-N(2))-methyltransferase RsmD [Acidobacteriota bacterium]